MALCVPSAGLGSFGLAPPDSFAVKGKERSPAGLLQGRQFMSCSSCICVRSFLLTASLYLNYYYFLIESLALGTFYLA